VFGKPEILVSQNKTLADFEFTGVFLNRYENSLVVYDSSTASRPDL
jgi:hypothetical protein